MRPELCNTAYPLPGAEDDFRNKVAVISMRNYLKIDEETCLLV